MKRISSGACARFDRRERGTAIIEFALVFPFLLVLTLTVVDLSRAFFIKNMLHQAAREGARTLVVMTMRDTSFVRGRVNTVAGAAKVPVTSLTYMGPNNRQMGVRVQSRFNWLFPRLFNWVGASFRNPMTLSAEAWMRKETP
jgi:hypothetical protein